MGLILTPDQESESEREQLPEDFNFLRDNMRVNHSGLKTDGCILLW